MSDYGGYNPTGGSGANAGMPTFDGGRRGQPRDDGPSAEQLAELERRMGLVGTVVTDPAAMYDLATADTDDAEMMQGAIEATDLVVWQEHAAILKAQSEAEQRAIWEQYDDARQQVLRDAGYEPPDMTQTIDEQSHGFGVNLPDKIPLPGTTRTTISPLIQRAMGQEVTIEARSDGPGIDIPFAGDDEDILIGGRTGLAAKVGTVLESSQEGIADVGGLGLRGLTVAGDTVAGRPFRTKEALESDQQFANQQLQARQAIDQLRETRGVSEAQAQQLMFNYWQLRGTTYRTTEAFDLSGDVDTIGAEQDIVARFRGDEDGAFSDTFDVPVDDPGISLPDGMWDEFDTIRAELERTERYDPSTAAAWSRVATGDDWIRPTRQLEALEALGSNWDQFDLAYQVAQGRSIDDIVQDQGHAPGTVEYAEAFNTTARTIYSVDPEVIGELSGGTYSLGRGLAEAQGLDPGSKPYTVVSGSADALAVMILDPTLLAGKVNVGRRGLLYGVNSMDIAGTVADTRRFRNLAIATRADAPRAVAFTVDHTPLRRFDAELRHLDDLGDLDPIVGRAPLLTPEGRASAHLMENYEAIVTAVETEAVRLSRRAHVAPVPERVRLAIRADQMGDTLDVLRTADVVDLDVGLRTLNLPGGRQLGIMAGSQRRAAVHMERTADRISEAFRARRAGDRLAFDKLRREMPSISAALDPIMDYNDYLRTTIGREIESADDIYDFYVDAHFGLQALGGGRFATATKTNLLELPRWDPSRAALNATKRGTERVINWLAEGKKGTRFLGKVPLAVTQQMPRSGVLNLVGPDSVEDFSRFVQTGAFVGMPAHRRARFIDDFIAGADDDIIGWSVAGRVDTLRLFMKEMLDTAGATADPRLKQWTDDILSRVDGQKFVYGPDDIDVLNMGSLGPTRAPIFVRSQHSTQMAIPMFEQVEAQTRRLRFMGRIWGGINHPFIDAAMGSYWKPAMVLKLGFIPRAAGEEMLAFFAKDGLKALDSYLATSVTGEKVGPLQALLAGIPAAPSRVRGSLGRRLWPKAEDYRLFPKEAFAYTEAVQHADVQSWIRFEAERFGIGTAADVARPDHLRFWARFQAAQWTRWSRQLKAHYADPYSLTAALMTRTGDHNDVAQFLARNAVADAYQASVRAMRHPSVQTAYAELIDGRHTVVGGYSAEELSGRTITMAPSAFRAREPNVQSITLRDTGAFDQFEGRLARGNKADIELTMALAYALNSAAGDPVMRAGLLAGRGAIPEDVLLDSVRPLLKGRWSIDEATMQEVREHLADESIEAATRNWMSTLAPGDLEGLVGDFYNSPLYRTVVDDLALLDANPGVFSSRSQELAYLRADFANAQEVGDAALAQHLDTMIFELEKLSDEGWAAVHGEAGRASARIDAFIRDYPAFAQELGLWNFSTAREALSSRRAATSAGAKLLEPGPVFHGADETRRLTNINMRHAIDEQDVRETFAENGRRFYRGVYSPTQFQVLDDGSLRFPPLGANNAARAGEVGGGVSLTTSPRTAADYADPLRHQGGLYNADPEVAGFVVEIDTSAWDNFFESHTTNWGIEPSSWEVRVAGELVIPPGAWEVYSLGHTRTTIQRSLDELADEAHQVAAEGVVESRRVFTPATDVAARLRQLQAEVGALDVPTQRALRAVVSGAGDALAPNGKRILADAIDGSAFPAAMRRRLGDAEDFSEDVHLMRMAIDDPELVGVIDQVLALPPDIAQLTLGTATISVGDWETVRPQVVGAMQNAFRSDDVARFARDHQRAKYSRVDDSPAIRTPNEHTRSFYNVMADRDTVTAISERLRQPGGIGQLLDEAGEIDSATRAYLIEIFTNWDTQTQAALGNLARDLAGSRMVPLSTMATTNDRTAASAAEALARLGGDHPTVPAIQLGRTHLMDFHRMSPERASEIAERVDDTSELYRLSPETARQMQAAPATAKARRYNAAGEEAADGEHLMIGRTYEENLDDWTEVNADALEKYFTHNGQLTHSTIEPIMRGEFGLDTVQNLSLDEIPRRFTGPKLYAPTPENFFQRGLSYGFDHVIGGSMSALIRRPRFTHNLARGLKANRPLEQALRIQPLYDQGAEALGRLAIKGARLDDARDLWHLIPPHVRREISSGDDLAREFRKLDQSVDEILDLDNTDELLRLRQFLTHDEFVQTRVTEAAMQRALVDTIPYIDDHRIRSYYQSYARNLTPFWFAQEQFLKRWARTLVHSPEALRRAQLITMGFSQSAFVHENEYGEKVAVLPLSEEAGLLATRMAAVFGADPQVPVLPPMTMDVKYMLPGIGADTFALPSLGPVAALPLNYAAQQYPELEPMATFMLGDRGIGRTALQQVMPAWFIKALGATSGGLLDPDGQYEARLTATTIGAIQMMEAESNRLTREAYALPDGSDEAQEMLDRAARLTISEEDTPQERQAYIDEVKNWARTMLVAQAAMGFVSPAGATFEFEGGELRADLQELRRGGMDIDEAMAMWLSRYPDAGPFSVVRTDSDAQLPSTEQALHFLQDNEGWISSFPLAGAWMLPQSTAEDEFSQRAYNEGLAMELRRRRTPEEWVDAYHFAAGAGPYFDSLDRLHAAQLMDPDRSSELQASFDGWADAYKNAHPAFAAQLTGERRSMRERTIEELQIALDDPLGPEFDHRPQLTTLLESFSAYEASLAAIPGRSRDDIDTRDAIRQSFSRWAERYIVDNPSVATIWRGLLEPVAGLRDDRVARELIPPDYNDRLARDTELAEAGAN